MSALSDMTSKGYADAYMAAVRGEKYGDALTAAVRDTFPYSSFAYGLMNWHVGGVEDDNPLADNVNQDFERVPASVAVSTCEACGHLVMFPERVEETTALDCPKCGSQLPMPAAWLAPVVNADDTAFTRWMKRWMKTGQTPAPHEGGFSGTAALPEEMSSSVLARIGEWVLGKHILGF